MIKKFSLFLAIGLLGLLLVSSCAPAAAPPQEEEAIRLPVIEVIPSVVERGGSVEFAGANFLPNEKLFIEYFYPPATEEGGPIKCGFVVTADEIGSFISSLKTRKEWDLVVSPVVVYDESGKVVASTLFVVEKPPEK